MKDVNPTDYVLIEHERSPLYIAKYAQKHSDGWEGALYRFGEGGGTRSTIKNFVDFYRLLISGKGIQDGKGNPLSDLEIKAILNDIFMENREEFFDNRFVGVGDKIFMLCNHKLELKSNNLKQVTYLSIEVPEEAQCDGIISLKNLDDYGLPKIVDSYNGDMVYNQPYEDSFASVVSGDGGEELLTLYLCEQSGWGENTLVREVREKL